MYIFFVAVCCNELKDTSALDNFETEKKISFPKAYKDVIKRHNAGIPARNSIRINDNQVTDVKLLLSFDEEDEESIYAAYPFFSKRGVVPFAVDSAGNYFCFDKDKIVFWEHEVDEFIELTKNFTLFLEKLY